ncbi:MAG: hypothetical protein ACI4UA_03290, partial [Bacteroidaceae bacterium]
TGVHRNEVEMCPDKPKHITICLEGSTPQDWFYNSPLNIYRTESRGKQQRAILLSTWLSAEYHHSISPNRSLAL